MKNKRTDHLTRIHTVRTYVGLILLCLPLQAAVSQILSQEVQDKIGGYLTEYAKKELSIGKIKIDSVANEEKTLILFANINCSYIPFREENVKEIYKGIQTILPLEYTKHNIQLKTDKHTIEQLIPCALPSKTDKRRHPLHRQTNVPLIRNLSVSYSPKYGLQQRHIALWQSHGYYYEAKLTRWEWQRARIFQTVEDLYTQSYVLPYLVPMLENAGANVLIPRERDTQATEIIIDNDGCRNNSRYTEKVADKNWYTGNESGFAHLRDRYIDFENPFREGTYRAVESIRKGKESLAEWIPDIPKEGRYAVYISYKTLPNSTDDATYTIYHKGCPTVFSVNQRMGGGTWIYLGHFHFDKGQNDDNKIVLTNKSSKAGRIVTADAVKIGGGYGNIARRPAEDGQTTENIKSSDTASATETICLSAGSYPYETSGYPRYTEAARYWMQWAGIPDSIYSESKGRNDYTDDYRSRGKWVNYLAGGSGVNPTEKGLNIPIDMALAFHSDAGTTLNDSIIGTLGIFYTNTYDGTYTDGTSRYAARDLTDLVQTSIVNDIRALYEPNWSRRGMWNQSYYEARVPRVPAMLLELLSHQNFADMRYGLDPRFRFTVSRSIYKGILRFLCSRYGQEYVVQPLPVDHMNLRFTGENEIELSWKPVDDPLEATAKANKYIVYTRKDKDDFDNGKIVNTPCFRSTLTPGMLYSYKVTALNEGGQSFPSEILSVAKAEQEKGVVLVVNGFDRISAPADFTSDSIAGFCDAIDHGVPDKEEISYIGSMKEFRRAIPWMDDDASGFGDSYGNYETQVIAGNTFDYPSVHGAAILKAGYSFVSTSDEAVENQMVCLNDYKLVDLILGKERQTKIGRGGVIAPEFKTFDPKLQKAITAYCQAGGNIFISGAFVGSDLWDNEYATKEDKEFATRILKYEWRVGRAAITGKVKSVVSPYPAFTGHYTYYNELNAESYVVESPDAIVPADDYAHTILRYSENNISAGIAYKGAYKTCVLGFPFESLRTAKEKEQLMKNILTFFNEK